MSSSKNRHRHTKDRQSARAPQPSQRTIILERPITISTSARPGLLVPLELWRCIGTLYEIMHLCLKATRAGNKSGKRTGWSLIAATDAHLQVAPLIHHGPLQWSKVFSGPWCRFVRVSGTGESGKRRNRHGCGD